MPPLTVLTYELDRIDLVSNSCLDNLTVCSTIGFKDLEKLHVIPFKVVLKGLQLWAFAVRQRFGRTHDQECRAGKCVAS
jgi:hypothetical protein